MSWQHLTFVSSLMVIMIVCAVIFGLRNRNQDSIKKNRVLVVAAILIDSLEIFKIIMGCFVTEDLMHWKYQLPLFLCSIQLIAIPMAAFCKGRLKDASMDFVTIFGVLGAVLGTYFAGQDYGSYPVLSFDNVVAGVTHSISGFAALYIMISGMTSMKKKNIPVTVCILGGFCAAAFIANKILDYNYMFLVRGDGTPYDIIYDLVGGSPVLYPICVVLLFVLYITVFYGVYYLFTRKKKA